MKRVLPTTSLKAIKNVSKHFAFLQFLKFTTVICFFLPAQFTFGQGVFGGKVAVLNGAGSTTYYNTNAQVCDGAGTGNLSTGNATAISAFLGDKFYIGGNVLTFGFGSSGDIGQIRYRYYEVGTTAPAYPGSYITLPYANNTVCGGGSNKKYELIPVSGTNTIQATATGNYRLDADLRGNNGGPTFTQFTSGNYIPFTVSALNDPSAQTATLNSSNAAQINLSWSKNAQLHNVMIVELQTMFLQLQLTVPLIL